MCWVDLQTQDATRYLTFLMQKVVEWCLSMRMKIVVIPLAVATLLGVGCSESSHPAPPARDPPALVETDRGSGIFGIFAVQPQAAWLHDWQAVCLGRLLDGGRLQL